MRIAIDTGGTFTDCAYVEDEKLTVLKVLSTPADPGEAVLRALSEIGPGDSLEVRHGTTVGTNTLLERKGARVAFVTTAGFEDSVEIGRQARAKLYDWFWTKDPSLVPEALRFGLSERTACDGSVLLSPSERELMRLKEAIRAAAPESVAISLLFSFANPRNEQAVAGALAELGLPISLSHEILPEFREYERASTVVINAYLAPRMQQYLGRLDREMRARGARFHVMQSSGGILPATVAAREPVRTILSGPAGGVVGATAVARDAGWKSILSFDMGGTSTDVALVGSEKGIETTKESQISGMPLAIPTLSIHTVGAGGGSLATFDPGGMLKVGPESAGADPGPICYGRGDLPTVTDANLLLGRLDPEQIFGGGIQLDLSRVRRRFEALKGKLASVEEFAEGILHVADSHMEKALRRISVEQGHDPRDFTLVSFGGAGPLHACALARALRVARVLIPVHPGALSAYGILISDFVRDFSRTVMLAPSDPAIEDHLCALETLGGEQMAHDGLRGSSIRSLDVRYSGQGYELEVPWSAHFVDQFHTLHEQRYGYADKRRALEVVNARVRMLAQTEPLSRARSVRSGGCSAGVLTAKEHQIYCNGAWHRGRIYERSWIDARERISGPAVIAEYSATTFLPPDVEAYVDERGNLVIETA